MEFRHRVDMIQQRPILTSSL